RVLRSGEPAGGGAVPRLERGQDVREAVRAAEVLSRAPHAEAGPHQAAALRLPLADGGRGARARQGVGARIRGEVAGVRDLPLREDPGQGAPAGRSRVVPRRGDARPLAPSARLRLVAAETP